MVGLGQHQQHAKFEVASFNHCINVKGELQNFGGPPAAQGNVHFFFGVGFYDEPW